MTTQSVADHMFEDDQEYPPFPPPSYLCNFCGHGKRVHRAQGCRPNNRRCDKRCRRFLA